MERKIQQQLVKYLRSKGCYVLNISPSPGIPTGCPDVIALYEGWWGAFECKASKTAKFQPLQKQTINKLEKWSTMEVVYPSNYDEVIEKLDKILI